MGGENENGSAGSLRSGPEWCAICNKPNADGECIGAGNGRGQRFAHVGCYRAAHPRLPAEPDHRDAKIAELEAKLAASYAHAELSIAHEARLGLQLEALRAEVDFLTLERDEARENLAAALARAEKAEGALRVAEEALEMAESYLGYALAYHVTPESCDCGRCAVLVAVRAAREGKT